MINLITRISVIGISIITAALIILLSAFNGIELMIERLYSEYDADITIRSSQGKTFNEQRIDFEQLKAIPGVYLYSRAVEEVVILKHEKKWVNANMIGVDSTFLSMTQMEKHIVDGLPYLEHEGRVFGIVGATLLDKLDGYIRRSENIPDELVLANPSEDISSMEDEESSSNLGALVGFESIVCYAPKNNMRIRPGKNPFKMEMFNISARINYNREVNAEAFIIPLAASQQLMGYDGHISAVYVKCAEDADKETVKAQIISQLGSDFVVKTSYEKNELIYKTSKSEKIIVLIILLFIFILAAFNLVASLTMLFVEKLENIQTMIGFGAQRKMVFKIFFFEGLLIAGKGILIGTVLGYAICLIQMNVGVITMPNSGGESFPMNISLSDGILILFLVSALSVIFSFFPVKYLIKKNIRSTK